MKNIWDLGFRDKPDVLAWEKEMMGERVERLATDFDMFNTWFDGLDEDLKAKDDGLDTRFDGLVIDKSTSSKTICQTTKYYQIIKYYQTMIWGYIKHMLHSHREYMGYRGLSKYRRIPPISYSETLSVSNIGMGDRSGYIRNTKPYLLDI
jgi:hypothetical protein